MPRTAAQAKRTIKLRQADALGREYIRIGGSSKIVWASCYKPNRPQAVRFVNRTYLRTDYGSPFVQIFSSNNPIYVSGQKWNEIQGGAWDPNASGALEPRRIYTPQWAIFTKPCDPHKGLF